MPTFDYKPFIPFKHEYNFVRHMFSHDCARPWQIYWETFSPCFVNALISLLDIDTSDIIIDLGRIYATQPFPGTGRHVGHGRRIKVHSEGTKPQKFFRTALKGMLIFDLPLEYLGWYWLLYGVVDNFFFEWQTLLQHSVYCNQALGTGPLIRSSGPNVCFPNLAGNNVPLPILDLDRGGWGSNFAAAGQPVGRYFGTLGATFTYAGTGTYTAKLRFHVTTSAGTHDYDGDAVTMQSGVPTDLIVAADWQVLGLAGAVSWEIVGAPIPVGLAMSQAHMQIAETSQMSGPF